MTTKHTPATPLPWHANLRGQVHDAFGNQGNTRDSTVALCITKNQHEDAAYIAHAANAYPRLVEALKVALAARLDDTIGVQVCDDLLRELGESE